jgi:hypothetical protein
VGPAVRIIFAPLFQRFKYDNDRAQFVHGTTEGRVIKLDPRSSELGKTLLHELLHVRHPSWSEVAIISETKLRWGKMGWKEKAKLYQMLSAAKIENEDG